MDSISYGQQLLADWYHELEEEYQHNLTAAELQFGDDQNDNEGIIFTEDYALLARMNEVLQ